MTVAVITRDLIDASKVEAVGAVVVRDASTPALRDAELIVLDLATGIDASTVVAIGPPVIAYGPHVDDSALSVALAAGCQEALARSVFFRRLPSLVR